VFGWRGTILRIDLTRRKIVRQQMPLELARDYIGGRGIGAKLLYDEVPARTPPLSRENKLYFTVGPLTGTPIGCGRVGLTSKSPQSGLYMEGSASDLTPLLAPCAASRAIAIRSLYLIGISPSQNARSDALVTHSSNLGSTLPNTISGFPETSTAS